MSRRLIVSSTGSPAGVPRRIQYDLLIVIFASVLAAFIAFDASAQIPMSGIAKATVGTSHACALTTGGGVKCWGSNSTGQLGDNSTVSRSLPVDVFGLTSGVSTVATRAAHTCALTNAGGVKCWGWNFQGQLGDSTNIQRLIQADVTGLTAGVAAIGVGAAHSCALTNAGGIKCWGSNLNGQLGDGSTTNRSTPVDVSGLTSGVTAIAVGDDHTCALTSSGGVKCWGANNGAQLGDGTGVQHVTPADVFNLTSGVTSIASGTQHSCAVTTGGGLKCWGSNASGQLGDGFTTSTGKPVVVLSAPASAPLSGVRSVSLGNGYTCVTTNLGGAKCWGFNGQGQLGDNSTTQRLTPVDVSTLSSGVAEIAGGYLHTCAVSNVGGMKCWGYNIDARLGDGTATNRLIPSDVVRLSSTVSMVAGGGYHSCALTTTGGVKCWGNNNNGQLGDPATTSPFWPIAVDVSGFATGASAIATGEFHSCALTTAGGVKCWGRNAEGQLGDGSTTNRSPGAFVSSLSTGVRTIDTGYRYTCAVTTAGGAKCWGDNSSGQLGDSTTINRLLPGFVPGLASGVSVIRPGQLHTCAVTTGGAAKCWGSNSSGQIGDGTTIQRLTVADVAGLTSGVKTLALGIDFTCALMTSGAVKCWGKNADGQLGDGTIVSKSTPVDVTGLSSGVAEIASGTAHTCALLTTGGVKCWGFNEAGRLGDGTTLTRTTPVDVLGLTSAVSALGVGLFHGCVVSVNGGVKCWGANNNGQLGDNTTTNRSTAGNTAFTFSITPSAGAHGIISPSVPTNVAMGESMTFTITANLGYVPNMTGTCGGKLAGTAPNYIYTTYFTYSNCSVTANFAPPPGAGLASILFFLMD